MTVQPSPSGYSLIELVVALLLLSLIAVATQSGLHFGAQVWRRSDVSLSAANRLWKAQNVLREILSKAQPRFKGEYSTFSGQPDVLSFDTAAPDAVARYGIARVTISVQGVGAHQALEIDMTPLRQRGVKKHATLVRDLRDVRFEYLDVTSQSAIWLSNWQDRTRLPDAVRIMSADTHDWPPLLIHLAIAESPACLFDPDTMTCRRP